MTSNGNIIDIKYVIVFTNKFLGISVISVNKSINIPSAYIEIIIIYPVSFFFIILKNIIPNKLIATVIKNIGSNILLPPNNYYHYFTTY